MPLSGRRGPTIPPRLCWTALWISFGLLGKTLATLADEGCVDWAGWSDPNGNTCDMYSTQGWCTSTGETGPTWNTTSNGAINDFNDNVSGLSALEACCGCGSFCVDLEGWVDSDGDNCATWVAERWCTADGTQGDGWDSSWGVVSSFTDRNGISAARACCGCGGGGARSHFRDALTTSVSTATCTDVGGWADAVGDGCDKWVQNEWCDTNGAAVGPGWDASWGTVASYAVGGIGPLVACCGCGGGVYSNQNAGSTTTETPCENHYGWRDPNGSTCEVYGKLRWCTAKGTAGPGWDTRWGAINDVQGTNQLTPMQACCACSQWGAIGPVAPQPGSSSDTSALSWAVVVFVVVSVCVFLVCLLIYSFLHTRHQSHILDEATLLARPTAKRASISIIGKSMAEKSKLDVQLSWDNSGLSEEEHQGWQG
eukprot:m.15679 g.15679  ORF g.15679 m.15679 type:complete len:425 (+) comp4949_c0_seq1:254-1528(+)